MHILEILLPRNIDDRGLSPYVARKIDSLQTRMQKYVDKIFDPNTSNHGREFLKSKLRDDYYELRDLIPKFHQVAEDEPFPTPKLQRYEVYDRHTGQVVGGPYSSRVRAIRVVDRKDNEYGAYRYAYRPVGGNTLNVAEGNIWHGTASGTSQAEDTDHTYDEAQAYVKTNYPYFKKYNIRRAEPGFRAGWIAGDTGEWHDRKDDELMKSLEHTGSVDAAFDYLGLEENPTMSGSAQATASIGYSWNTLEKKDSGIAVLYYQDRGMGNDQILVAAKNKEQLLKVIKVFQDSGVIQSSEERKERRTVKAQTRNDLITKKGIKIGSKLDFGSPIYGIKKKGEVIGITPGGKIKVKITDFKFPNAEEGSWQAEHEKKQIGKVEVISPGSVSKKNIISEAVRKVPITSEDFDIIKKLMDNPIPAIMGIIVVDDLIDDDSFNDEIRSLEDLEPDRDIRPLIMQWIERVMPDQLFRFGTPKELPMMAFKGQISPIHGYNPSMKNSGPDSHVSPSSQNAYGMR